MTYYRSNEIIGVDSGTGNFSSWDQSIWTSEITFDLAKNLQENIFIDSIKHAIVGYNETTGQFFIIDQFVFPMPTAKINVGGALYQGANIGQTRDLGIPSTDQISQVLTQTIPPAVFEPSVEWKLQHGFKISWRDWIPLNGVPAEFYNAFALNDGFNKKTSNYSESNDFKIFGFLLCRTRVNTPTFTFKNVPEDPGGGTFTQYILQSGESRILDFNKDNNNPQEWGGEIELFIPSNGDLTDDIPTNLDVGIRAKHTNPDIGTSLSSDDMFGELRIEVNGTTDNDDRLSTTGKDWDQVTSKLKPKVGETHVTITETPGEIQLECLVNSANLDPNVLAEYNISSELIEKLSAVPVDGRITEDSQPRITEDGQQRIIE